MPANRGPLRRTCAFILLAAPVGLILMTVAGLAGPLWWGFDLLAHFRAQYAILLAVATIGLLWRNRRAIACIALAGMVINVYPVVRMYWPAPAVDESVHDSTIRIFHLNAWHVRNQSPTSIPRLIESSDAHLVFIQESSPSIIEALDSLEPEYRIVAQPSPQDSHHSVMLIRHAGDPTVSLLDVSGLDIGSADRTIADAALEAKLRVGHRTISILSMHASAPGTSSRHRARHAEFATINAWVHAQHGPAIVIGDLNSTPWSADFRSLMAKTGLVNSQQGYGYQGTWPRRPPAWLTWVLTIPIDHCLHSPEVVTLDRRVGSYAGSDHLPLIVTLGLKEATDPALPTAR